MKIQHVALELGIWLGLDLGLVLLLPRKLKSLDLALLVKRWLSYEHLVNLPAGCFKLSERFPFATATLQFTACEC